MKAAELKRLEDAIVSRDAALSRTPAGRVALAIIDADRRYAAKLKASDV